MKVYLLCNNTLQFDRAESVLVLNLFFFMKRFLGWQLFSGRSHSSTCDFIRDKKEESCQQDSEETLCRTEKSLRFSVFTQRSGSGYKLWIKYSPHTYQSTSASLFCSYCLNVLNKITESRRGAAAAPDWSVWSLKPAPLSVEVRQRHEQTFAQMYVSTQAISSCAQRGSVTLTKPKQETNSKV